MKTAKDYIIFPLDVPSVDAARDFVRLLSNHVGMFKVGLELLSGPARIWCAGFWSQALPACFWI